MALYQQCRKHGGLTDRAAAFWDRRGDLLRRGIGEAGKFERYFRIFRRSVLPLIHSRSRVNDLLRPKPRAERERFYSECWDNRRWRLLFRLFFSRTMMGLLGRDPSFFKYVEGSVADRILARARHALVQLEPADNPYLHWIVTGTHGDALPLALRPEHFATIRDHVDRVHGHVCSIEEFLANDTTAVPFDAFNLSDIFEYMSVEATESLLRHLVAAARPAAALLWWNMLAPRGVPESMRHCLDSETERAEALHGLDSAFFYSRVVIARVIGQC